MIIGSPKRANQLVVSPVSFVHLQTPTKSEMLTTPGTTLVWQLFSSATTYDHQKSFSVTIYPLYTFTKSYMLCCYLKFNCENTIMVNKKIKLGV